MSCHIQSDIETIRQKANYWLHSHAIPIWFEKGVDWNHGGFFEFLNFDDLMCDSHFKRVRVLTRQIYVFSAASRLGDRYAREAVTQGVEYLLNKYRLPSGGFASRVTIQGDIIDGPIELYDLAFCLFALAHSYKLLNDNRLEDEAISLALFIFNRFKHKSEGYVESIPENFPRRQNPHMHLLEALLEWMQLSDNSIFKDISEEIVILFFNKFYISNSGALLEYFDDDWKPISGSQGQITEPGHHFEWAWLLNRYKNISGQQVKNISKLYDFAHYHGVNNATHLLWGEVTSVGDPVSSLVRLWPHTEWIKAELAMENPNNLSVRLQTAWCALDRFLTCPQPGLWHEIFDHEANKFLDTPAPASSLYHIVLAIEELNRHVLHQ